MVHDDSGYNLTGPEIKTHTANTQTVCYGFKSHFAAFRESNNGSSTEIMCLVNIGDSYNGSTQDVDSYGGSSILSSPAKGVARPEPLKQCGRVEGHTSGFIPDQSNGKTADSDSAFGGSTPSSGAMRYSVMVSAPGSNPGGVSSILDYRCQGNTVGNRM